MTRLLRFPLAAYTNHMGRGQMKRLVVASVLSSALSYTALAQDDAASLRPVESYQVQSQYGPEVAVLNPIYDTEKSIEFSAAFNASPFSSLYYYYGLALAGTYHLNRRHALEGSFQYNLGDMTSFTKTEIADKPKTNGNDQYGVEIPKMILALSYVFTPYYTKMHFTDMKVVHAEIFTSIGPAAVNGQELLLNDVDGASRWSLGAALGIGFKVLWKDRWGTRLEFRDLIHKSKNVGSDSITNDLQATLGFSFYLDSFPDYSNY